MWTAPEERHPRLISDLHTGTYIHSHVCAYTHRDVEENLQESELPTAHLGRTFILVEPRDSDWKGSTMKRK